MEMEILTLPYVAQRYLIKNMSFSCRFLLYFCSERMTRLVRSCKLKDPQLTLRFNFCGDSSLCIKTQYGEMEILNISNETKFAVRQDAFFFNIEQSAFQVQGYFTQDNKLVCRERRHFNNTFKAFRHHLMDVFKLSPDVILCAETLKQFSFEDKNIFNVIHFIGTPLEEIDTILTDYPNNKLSILEPSAHHRVFTAIHTIVKFPDVIHRYADVEVMWFLLFYEGNNVLLEMCTASAVYIETFVEKWLNNKKNNLKTFIAYQNPTKKSIEIHRKLIPDGYRLLPHNNGNLPQRFTYDSIIAKHYNFPDDTFDCSRGFDLIRRDGKTATIKIAERYFMFFVWP